ncbi:MAG: phosphopyruvate hydratase [Candidatus Moranbacteria bacterium]|nr:phosphopyruvate hydratase [Candidatus Moranbacteria bacterium]MBP6034161.1 phosphopyruvate hydratase [Candidatus Moranbacteria bacterium]MBP7695738.1 phosphopyruvate hydratase [Candidatus Moranbacteria bacterium]
MAIIKDVQAREILDSRGNPTVEVVLGLEDGTTATAAVPSGASTGTFEAHELRDGNPHRYGGLGVLGAVNFVNTELKAAVIGIESTDQSAVDAALIACDGTENKSRVGANAILGISLAAARASAISRGVPLYRHIADLTKTEIAIERFPIPMFNILNGGKHSDSGLSVQEFKLVPSGISTYPEQLRAGSEIFHALKKLLEKDGFSTGVGDEGGFAPHLTSHAQALEKINQAIADAEYAAGEQVFLGLDVAANSFYAAPKDRYELQPENTDLTRDALVDLYQAWMRKYHIVSIEDGLHEEDWDGWKVMKDRLEPEPASWGKPLLLIGDDLLVTNIHRLEKSLAAGSCNSVLIKPNQIGTLSETLSCMALAHANGHNTVISHRSGETSDDFIADLAVGAGARFIKTGSLSRGERLAKYNRLLKIWGEL